MTAPPDTGPTHVGAGGDVTALTACVLAGRSLLLVGVGSQLHVVDGGSGGSGDCVACATVLPAGARVHGVRTVAEPSDASTICTRVFVHGDRWVAAWVLAQVGADTHDTAPLYTLTPLSRWRAHSWVHDVLPLGGDSLAVGTADNAVTLVDVPTTPSPHRSPWPPHPAARCDAGGVLYSMALTVHDGSVWVASGAAFLDIVLWRVEAAHLLAPPPTTTTLATPTAVLAGHTGSIHRLVWAPSGDAVASASDDRSVRVWRVGRGCGGTDDTPPSPIAVFAGHGARVWDVTFLGSDLEPATPAAPPAYAVSACEDGAARVWAVAPPAPHPTATLRGHTGRGVWRVAAAPGGTIITAGADGAALAWRAADFVDATAARAQRDSCRHHIPWPPGACRPKVSCLAALPALPGVLLVGAGDGGAWRVEVGNTTAPWRRLLPPSPALGSVLSLDAGPCWRCGDAGGVVVIAGCGRGHAALACDCGGGGESSSDAAPPPALTWAAAPAAPGAPADRLPLLQRVYLPASLGGRIAVTASTLGDVRVWRVPHTRAATTTPPPLLAAAPPRRVRRREATVAAVAACDDLLFVTDAAGGVSMYRLPSADNDTTAAATPPPLPLLARATTPGATAATCITLGPGMTPPSLPAGALEVRVGDAAGRVTAWRVSSAPPTLTRCGGDRAPFPVVTHDGVITPTGSRLLAGFRGDDWCACAPDRGGGAELVREAGTGGWRRPAALVPGGGDSGSHTSTPPTLVWSPPHRAGDAPGLALRSLAPRGWGGPPPRLALPAGHGLEVWAGALLPGPEAGSSITAALATAGEDGALIITRVAPHSAPGGLLPPSARAGGLLDGASLRALAVLPTPCGSGDFTNPPTNDWLLFAAGGGGGGVTAWRGWWHEGGTDDDDVFSTAWVAASTASPRTNARVAAAVPRAMGVTAVGVGDGDGVMIAVALSTGVVAVHTFSARGGAFVGAPATLPSEHVGAVLCIGAAGGDANTALVVTGGTDGRLVVWRGAQLPSAAKRASDTPAAPTTIIDAAHQSGVLTLSLVCAPTPTPAHAFTLVTGGDDQAMCVVWLDASGVCTRHAHFANAHASAVRGMWTDGAVAVSAGLDRTLAGWRLVDGPDNGDVEGPLWTRRTQVPAPAGVAGLARRGGSLIAVVGRGCQVWHGC